jgi:hypothetical protein
MLTAILILVFLIVAACNWWFGLWSNLICLINVLLSAMVASSFYQNLEFELMQLEGTYRLLWTFLAQWILFAVTYGVLRGITDTLSGLRLKFDPITELAGRSILALLLAWTFVCFASFTLQRAPLPESWFPDGAKSQALGPDWLWVGFIRGRSTGSLAYPAAETMLFPPYQPRVSRNGQEVVFEVREFDPIDSYIDEGRIFRKTVGEAEQLRVIPPPR